MRARKRSSLCRQLWGFFYVVLHRHRPTQTTRFFIFSTGLKSAQLGSYVVAQTDDGHYVELGEEEEKKRTKTLLLMFYDRARANDVRMSSDSSLRSSFEGVRSGVVILAETGFRQRKNTLLSFVEARIKETLRLEVACK